MIKELYLLYRHDRDNGGEGRIFKTAWARWKEEGFEGMRKKLRTEYAALQEEYGWFHRRSKHYESLRLRTLFFTVFLLVTGYYMFIESERYESEASIIVKDLNEKSAAALGITLLGAGAPSQAQDSMILEAYLLSPDILALLNRQFHLDAYYRSDALDPLSRLHPWSTREDFLALYREHIHVVYDEVSGILRISFSHTDPETARDILQFLIARAEKQLNRYNERNAEKQLAFVRKLAEQNRERLDASTEALEAYQNRHLVLDPATDAQTQSAIIANLESTLVEKQAEYNRLKHYMSDSSFDLVNLVNEIRTLEASLKKAKAALSGSDTAERLNSVLFAYERLKAQVAFDQEVYKQNLVQLETAKVDANRQAKALVILTQPNLPDGYTYPDKPRLLATLALAFLLAYGIVSMLGAIIKDHKD